MITDWYGVKTTREFPVAKRVIAEVIQLEAMPLYQEGAVERMLEGVRDVAAS